MNKYSIFDWPKGLHKDLARTKLDIVSISKYINAIPENGHDDLDYYSAIITESPYGPICFQKYKRIPSKETLIIIMDSNLETSATIAWVLEKIPPIRESITWAIAE